MMTAAPRNVSLLLRWCAAVLLFSGCGGDQAQLVQPAQSSAGTPAAAPRPAAQPPEDSTLIRPRVSADALTLQQLISEAHTIVLGTVRSIESTTIQLKSETTTSALPVRVVTVSVTRALKGPVTNGGTLVVRQSAAESAPLAVGEEVLWYLDEPSEIGLTQPLGFYSGDFRVFAVNDQRQVMNLRGNAELWEGSLWTGAESINQSAWMNSARELGIATGREAAMIKIGSSPPSEQMPLDLLLSATASQVRRPQ